MTLIGAFASPSVGLVAISDIVVSTLRPQDSAPKVPLPMRPDGVVHRPGTRAICGTDQKSVVIGRVLLQWAGHVDIAKQILSDLRRISDDGQVHVPLPRLMQESNLNESQWYDVRLIYHFNNDPDTILKWDWMCEHENYGDADLFYEGSGARSYFQETVVTAPSGTPAPDALMGEAFNRVVEQYSIEMRSDERFYQYYGGWIEMLAKSEDGFRKVPYAVKFWFRDPQNLLHSSQLLFSQYVGSHLRINRVDFATVDGVTSGPVKPFVVYDPLSRGMSVPPPLATPIFAPYVIFHIYVDFKNKEARSKAYFEYSETLGISVSISDENVVTIGTDPAFQEWLDRETIPDEGSWLSRSSS